MILEKNKEIQYMNMRSIVLEISAFKFFGRGCSKIVCPKTCFLEQTFLGTASVCRIFNSNFPTIRAYHILNFGCYPLNHDSTPLIYIV